MIFLLCGFGAFVAVQLIKASTIMRHGSPVKLVLALFISAGLAAVIYRTRWPQLLLYALGGAGLSVVIHRFARLVSVAGDWLILEIKRRPPRV